LYTESLARGGTARDGSIMASAVDARRQLLLRLGCKRWDEERITGDELLVALKKSGRVNPRRLSVLHRLISLVTGRKTKSPSEELSKFSMAVTDAVREADPEGACGICLSRWELGDTIIVPSCGHSMHADCFWKLVAAPCSAGYRGGCCRTCRRSQWWGPLVRANLHCTLLATAESALKGVPRAFRIEAQKYIGLRITEELGERC